uniref:NADH dehydrogenase subunit 5 n=1 Tax=Laqueus japonicus TaxID=147651 RepID=UPI000EF2ECE9|nr:NADH dehydrogenase subunit 5 [Laqueus japonicus]AYI69524.1 NADH dehydrogenase subunit 5 [Laqueus japonicus]
MFKSLSLVLVLSSSMLIPLGVSCSYFKAVLLEWELFSVGPVCFFFPILLDKMGIFFSLVVLMISGLVFWYSHSYMSSEIFPRRFGFITVLFVVSMNILIYVPNLVSLLLGWDGLGLISFCLVIYYQNKKSLASGMITALMNRVGDACLVLVIAGFLCFGHWSILYQEMIGMVLGVMVVVAASTKSAQIPFSSWLPAAMAAPTPISALVHSSTLVTAGVYLSIRFHGMLFSSAFVWGVVLFLGVSTTLMASSVALVESDLKKVVALSTLSQLGLMFCSLVLMSPEICLFHLIMHSLFKALLFLAVGNIIHSHGGSQDLRSVGMLSGQFPVTVASMNVSFLAMSGTPFLAAFYSKDMIIQSSVMSGFPVLVLVFFLISLNLTVPYCVRMAYYTLWGSPNQGGLNCLSDQDSIMTVPMLALSVGSVLGGAVMSRVLVPICEVVVLSWELFLLPVLSIGGGILLSGFILLYGIGGVGLNFLLMQMWFLKDLSLPVVGYGLGGSGAMMKVLDQGWNEYLTAKSSGYILVPMFSYGWNFQLSTLKPLVFFSGWVLVGAVFWVN